MVFCCSCPITNALIIGAVGFFIYRKYFKTPKIRAKPEIVKKDYKKDVVYLYQFPASKECRSLSPFCLKLETIFRAYNIPYEPIFTMKTRSRNGQLPFIELNGEHIADSDLIEIRVKQHFKVPTLSKEQEAQTVSLTRMVDNHLFNLLIRYKFATDIGFNYMLNMLRAPVAIQPYLLPIAKWLFGRKIYFRSVGAIGDFEEQELDLIFRRDLTAIQDSLSGNYVFGDEFSAVDASIFGQLASVYYPFPNYLREVLDKDYPRLVDYLERIKNQFYPNDFTK